MAGVADLEQNVRATVTRTPNAEMYRALAATWATVARQAIERRDPVNALIRTHHAIRCEIESGISWKMGL